MKLFKKALLKTGRAVITTQGWPIQFEDVGGDNGVIQTNDPYTIDQLSKLATAGRLGVTEITQAEYEELKKKAPLLMQRSLPAWSASPVRVESKVSLRASPATSGTKPIDHSLPPQVPTGKPLEIPEVPEPPAAPKRTRRPAATKPSKPTETLEAAATPVQDPA